MSSFKIRPRFKQEFTSSPEEIIALFKDKIEHDNEFCSCRATFSGNHIILRIPEEEQHYWSPQLSLTVEESEEGSHVRGLFGPPPSVWTMFAFAYFGLGIAFVITALVGLSFRALDQSSWLLWLLPVYLVAALVLYLIAQFGQKLGAEQTFTLHHFYEETVGKRTHLA